MRMKVTDLAWAYIIASYFSVGCNLPTTVIYDQTDSKRDASIQAEEIQEVSEESESSPLCSDHAWLGKYKKTLFYSGQPEIIEFTQDCEFKSQVCLSTWTVEEIDESSQTFQDVALTVHNTWAGAVCKPSGTHSCRIARYFDPGLLKNVLSVDCGSYNHSFIEF